MVRVSSDSPIYKEPYPERFEDYSEWEKLSWTIGTQTRLLKHVINLYIDGYPILPTRVNISDKTTSTTDLPSEGTALVNLIQAFQNSFPGETFKTIEELQIRWLSLLKESVTPNGFKEFTKFLVSSYIIRRKIDLYLEYSSPECPVTKRLDNLSDKVKVFLYEWSATQTVVVAGHIFMPGTVPFMSVDILIGVDDLIFDVLNKTELQKYLLESYKAFAENKLTPTLGVNAIIVVEASKW